MITVTIMVREVGRTKPDFSLKFRVPEVPRVGDYISIFRPDCATHTEDVVVRHIWWIMDHTETRGFVAADDEVVGKVKEIVVECEQAIGPTSRDQWRDQLDFSRNQGVNIAEFDIERLSIRESELRHIAKPGIISR